MPVSLWTSAALLARVRRYLRQPSTSDFPGDTDIYAALSETDNQVRRRVLMACPWLMLSAPTLMTTADSGLTFTFGLDSDGSPIQPMGGYALFRQTTDVPDFPLEKGVDYLDEGNRIRMPAGRASQINWPGGAPYFYGNLPSVQISSLVEPTLEPVDRRVLLVWGACASVGLMLPNLDITPFEERLETGIQEWVASAQLATANPGALAAQRAVMPNRYRLWRSPYAMGPGAP